MKIRIISASAGSGKTTRLVSVLRDAVLSGEVRPEAILVTTFTNKAADELQERVRSSLLAEGKTEEAQRLGVARIGTVNSICDSLVREFAFDLGLPPDLRVLDQEQSEVSLRRAQAEAVNQEDQDEIACLSERLGGSSGWRRDDADEQPAWQRVVQEVVNLARANGIRPEQLCAKDPSASEPGELSTCAQRSMEDITKLMDAAANDGTVIESELLDTLRAFVRTVEENGDVTQVTQRAVARVKTAIARLEHERSLPWNEWANLCNLAAGAKSMDAAAKVSSSAIAHNGHPRLRDDVRRQIEMVFRIARNTLAAYEDYKRKWSLLDFVDQEVLALDLLGREDVQERLGGGLDLVLVDEFQDTSPLQLKIFLCLASLAQKSVWVGDQKQAIYSFRGADPALMDAAVTTIIGEDEPETLKVSYRSRAPLVRLTSDLYSKAFERHGIPESRVRLKPEQEQDTENLGSVLERLCLACKNQPDEASTIGAAVRDLLSDESCTVRDQAIGSVRKAKPKDVAVLCFKNKTCAEVATALESLGIPAKTPRKGLLCTPESLVALASLKLFVDPRDSLAAAELARLTEFSDRENDWLGKALESPRGEGFQSLGVIQRIKEARMEKPLAGALAAFDAALEAAQVREICLRWGKSSQRLANLDALRIHARQYVERCLAEGKGCTPAGLAAFLSQLAGTGNDECLIVPAHDAVTVATWHGAKGLEWPIVVLLAYNPPEGDAFGVHIVDDREKIDFENPLGSRWIRYWPYPYGQTTKNVPLYDRVWTSPPGVLVQERREAENLRLLYMGWTRARDRLILAGRPKMSDTILSLLKDTGCMPLLAPVAEDVEVIDLPEHNLAIKVRHAKPEQPPPLIPEADEGYDSPGPKDYPPAFVQPSEIEESGVTGDPVRIGERLGVASEADLTRIGNALHGFFAADRPHYSPKERLEIVEGLLDRWGIPTALKPEAVTQSGESLRQWIESSFPAAKWHREMPVEHRLANGSVVRGTADLVLETEQGLVLVDHKSFPGNTQQALDRARSHAGQLRLYAEALKCATGKQVVGTFIHLPISGYVIPVSVEV